MGSTGIGDYIAAGLGATNLDRPSIESTFTSQFPETDLATQVPSLKIANTSRIANKASSPTHSFMKIITSTKISPLSRSIPPSSQENQAWQGNITTSASSSITEANTTYGGNCWDQWTSFWALSEHRTHFSNTPGGISLTAFNTTDTWSYSGPINSTRTYTGTDSDVSYNNGFTVTTQYSYWTGEMPYPSSTWVATSTYVTYALTTLPLPTPACKLPSIVSQCQSEWSAYASAQMVISPSGYPDCDYGVSCGSALQSYSSVQASYSARVTPFSTSPRCPQASIGADLCASLRSNNLYRWTSSWNVYSDYYDGQFQSVGWINPTITMSGGLQSQGSAYWPANSTLAPGCTVGCASCAITGGTVQLIYWPEATTTANASAAQSVMVTAFAFNTTFTSPTIYISYATLYASDSCSAVGTTYYSTIIPLANSNQLSSLWQTFPFPVYYTGPSSASFNFTDLYYTPVPNSIYDRQPRCAAFTYDLPESDWIGTPPSCPRNIPYKPFLVVPPEIVRSIDPAWQSCSLDIRGAYDPPYALDPQTAAAAPVASFTSANARPSQTPKPGSVIQPAGPAPTSTITQPAPDPSGSSDPEQSSNPSASLSLGSSGGSNSGSSIDGSSNSDPGFDPGSIFGSMVRGSSRTGSAPAAAPETGPTSAAPTSSAGPGILSILEGGGSTSEGSAMISGTGSYPAINTVAGSGAGTVSASSGEPDPDPVASSGPVSSAIHGSDSVPSASLKSGSGFGSAVNPGGIVASMIGGSASSSNSESSATVQTSSDPSLSPKPESGGGLAEGSGTESGSGLGVNSGSDSGSAGQQSSSGSVGSPDPNAGGSYGDPLSHSPNEGSKSGSEGSDSSSGGSQTGVSPSGGEGLSPIVSAGGGSSKLSGAVIDGSTLSAGQTATIGGTQYLITPAGLAVGDSTTYALPTPTGESTTSGESSSGADGVAGNPILGSSNDGAGSVSTQSADGAFSKASLSQISTMASQAIVTIGGQTYAATPGQPFFIGSTAILPNGPAATISREAISVGLSGVVIGSNTVPFSAASNLMNGLNGAESEASATFPKGQAITAFQIAGYSGMAVISGINGSPTSMSVGGPAATMDGHTISLASSGLVIDVSSTMSFQAVSSSQMSDAIFTASGQAITAIQVPGTSSAAIIDNSVTLKLGGPATVINGESVSLVSNGIVIGGSMTQVFSAATIPPTSTVEEATFTADGHTFTAMELSGSSGQAVIDSSITLNVGGLGTIVSGKSVSLASNGLVLDRSTTEGFSAVTASNEGIDLASSSGQPTSTIVVQSENASKRKLPGQHLRLYGVLALACMMIYALL